MLVSLALFALLAAPQRPSDRQGEDEAVRLAREVLSQRLKVPEDRIQLGHVSTKNWPDASLGCPQKGMAYAQVVTPGYWVQLQVGETIHDVRVGGGRALVCEPVLETGKRETYVGTMARLYGLARRDLAARLKVEGRDVKVSSVKAQTWPDASLGCAAAGTSPSPGETKGFLIELTHEDKTYEYHSDMEKVVLCTKVR